VTKGTKKGTQKPFEIEIIRLSIAHLESIPSVHEASSYFLPEKTVACSPDYWYPCHGLLMHHKTVTWNKSESPKSCPQDRLVCSRDMLPFDLKSLRRSKTRNLGYPFPRECSYIHISKAQEKRKLVSEDEFRVSLLVY